MSFLSKLSYNLMSLQRMSYTETIDFKTASWEKKHPFHRHRQWAHNTYHSHLHFPQLIDSLPIYCHTLHTL